ncbi:arginine--tRNA ligase [Devosia nitrariae]|uniref:Arginine--tRNA ligase n=1 Tax=Devosia nitrariae TaxID=2071872 RepID=A0ABQ5W5W6_9HYPH|nr:arginine--tRNA ligase [Devosia nitrariae]GLQ55163.1 arginine--tRNA ligase [Devosia nitrariae]
MQTVTAVAAAEAALVEAFKALGLPIEHALASPPHRNSKADFQCNGALALAGKLGKKPLDLAQAITAELSNNTTFELVEVTGPGFINCTLSQATLVDCLEAALASSDLGIATADNARTIVLDFGGPNVAKPLHVGHLRSLVLGESLRRILIASGHTVISDIPLGDWGLQMGQLISELQLRMPDLVYFDRSYSGPYPSEPPIILADLEGMYPVAAAACKADPERLAMARIATAELQAGRPGYRALWSHFRALSMTSICADIDQLGAHFDLLAGESDTQPIIAPLVDALLANEVATQSQGAIVIDVQQPEDSDRPIPPLILVKSDGAAMYGTTDLATIKQRTATYAPDEIIYVVDQRQAEHFTQVFRAAAKAGFTTRLTHCGFGTVNGADGKPLKTRAGGTAKLGELIADAKSKADLVIPIHLDDREQLAGKIAIGALKFADLSSKRLTGYTFDLDRAISFEGKTGPYFQYAAVRMASILEKAGDARAAFGADLRGVERDLALQCLSFAAAVQQAVDSYEPSEIATYAFELAQTFSRFYTNCPVLTEPDKAIRASRLALCALTSRTLEKSLWLLGIEIPERM